MEQALGRDPSLVQLVALYIDCHVVHLSSLTKSLWDLVSFLLSDINVSILKWFETIGLQSWCDGPRRFALEKYSKGTLV